MSAPSIGNTVPRWTVTGQAQTRTLGPGGQFVDGMNVTFTTAAGITGSVFVPYSQYTPDGVAALVGPRAAQLDAITGLTG